MIRRYSSIIGLPLVDFNEGNTLALLRDIIVNPDSGKIEAFWVKPVGNIFANLIVQTQDILEWKKKIYTRDDSALATAEEVLRIAEILKKETPIIDQRVKGASGANYGTVSDLEFNDSTFDLKQIYTQKRLLGLIPYVHFTFTAKKIVQITSENILVDDDPTEKQVVVTPTLSEG